MPVGRRVAGYVFRIEKIRFAAASSRHPLPTEVVTGEVTVQEVPVHPVCCDTPTHLSQVHDIAGQPHARVVMQVSSGVQSADRLINNGYTGGSLANIRRQQR